MLCVGIVLTGALPLSCVHEPVNPVSNGGDPGTNPGTNPPPEEQCDPEVVYFNQVFEIFNSNCAVVGCHVGSDAPEGITFESYEDIMNGTTDDDDLITPGSPGDSEIYEAITDNDPDDRMPLNRPALKPEQIALIRKWIEQGAEDITCTSGECNLDNVTYLQTIKPIVVARCTGCHGNTNPAGGLNYNNYADLQKVALNGKLLPAIRYESATPMPQPPGGNPANTSLKLPDCDISKIEKWVSGGALNN